jgi:hypothetical protein
MRFWGFLAEIHHLSAQASTLLSAHELALQVRKG